MYTEYDKTSIETYTYLPSCLSVGCLLCSWSRSSRSNVDRGVGVGVSSIVEYEVNRFKRISLAPPFRWAPTIFFIFLSHQFHIIDYNFFFFDKKKKKKNTKRSGYNLIFLLLLLLLRLRFLLFLLLVVLLFSLIIFCRSLRNSKV